jgi:hypothetical protein
MKKFIIIIILILNFCTISENPLAPNGPFGLLSLYYNLSKVGQWSYTDSEILYYSVNAKTFDNQPIINREFINSFRIRENLPDGLSLNPENGVISGTPTKELPEKEFKVYAKLNPYPEIDKNFASLTITINDFTMYENINFPIYTNFPFPSSNTYSNFSMVTEPNRGMQIDKDSGIITGDARTENSDTIIKVKATRNDGKQVVGTGKLKITEWVHEAYIKAPNAETNDKFGGSDSPTNAFHMNTIAISGDTIVVGTDAEDSIQTTITNGTITSSDNSSSNSGAVYVFRRTGTTWSNEAYIKAPNNIAGIRFGASVAVSNDTIVVGANAEDSNQTTITNGTTASSDTSAPNSGAAYVFRRTGSTWSGEAYLKAPNAEGDLNGDWFGISVAIDGDTIVVGAYKEDSLQTTITNGTLSQGSDVGSSNNTGAAYVYRRNGTIWTNEAYLKAPNVGNNDQFGSSLSISGDTIAVCAYLEDSNQSTITNGTTASSDDSAVDSGATYVFRRNGNIWSNEAYIKSSNTKTLDTTIGCSVSINGDTIVTGISSEDVIAQNTITNGSTSPTQPGTNFQAGAAFVYRRLGSNWYQEAYLKAPVVRNSDNFGRAVSISNNTIVVGADGQDSNQTSITNGTTTNTNISASNSGAAYVFKRNGNYWYNQAFLKAPNAGSNDFFGISVFIAQDTIVVGAVAEDSNQTTITNGTTASADNSASNSGAVYVFRRK